MATLAAAPAIAQTPPPPGKAVADMREPTETIDLWPGIAPGAPARMPVETVIERSTDPGFSDRAVFGISRPRLVVFRASKPNGSAMLITPGGGFKWVVVDKEGYEMGRWLAVRGVTAFVLFVNRRSNGTHFKGLSACKRGPLSARR